MGRSEECYKSALHAHARAFIAGVSRVVTIVFAPLRPAGTIVIMRAIALDIETIVDAAHIAVGAVEIFEHEIVAIAF